MTRAEEIHRVTPELFVWQAYEPAVKCDLTSAALVVKGVLVLIDPIALIPEALEELLEAGDPALIVCTNGNHARAAAWYREKFGARVVAHRDAEGELEVSADEWLGDDARLLDAIEVCPIQGAVAGEIALRFGGIVCVGDAVIHLPSHGFALLPEKYCRDAKVLRQSMRNVLRWDFRILTFAHGLPLTTAARSQLAALLE